MAVALMQGVKFARGGQLPFEMLDALAMSEEEASAVQTDVNVQIVIDETLREARG